MIDSPILVGGCGSSGTSLLSQLLNAHPSIYCGPELFLLNKKALYNTPFEKLKPTLQEALQQPSDNQVRDKAQRKLSSKLYRRLQRLLHIRPTSSVPKIPITGVLDIKLIASSTYLHPRYGEALLSDPEEYGFTVKDWIELINKSQSLRELLDSFFQPFLDKYQKTRWAEKMPSNCYCISEFLALYPNGKYVHVVRDGRDVVPSLIKRGTSTEGAVRRWIHDTAIGIPYRGCSQYYEVRYEDLVNQPQSTLTKLIHFLGEHENTVETMLENYSRLERTTSHETWSVQTNEPISNKATGKWKRSNYQNKHYFEQLFHSTRLSSAVATQFNFKTQLTANDILREFDYDPADEWNQTPHPGAKLITHYLQEKFYETLYRQKLYSETVL